MPHDLVKFKKMIKVKKKWESLKFKFIITFVNQKQFKSFHNECKLFLFAIIKKVKIRMAVGKKGCYFKSGMSSWNG